MVKIVQVCLLHLALLQSCSWSCPGPTTPTSPATNTATETPMPANNRNTVIRRYDVEVNSFCRMYGSTSVYLNWGLLQINAQSRFQKGCGREYRRSLLTLDEIDLLPPNTIVKSARIKLFGNTPGDFQAYSSTDEYEVINEVLIKRVLNKWNANTVTWMSQPNTTDINAAVIPSTRPTFPTIAVNTELYNFTIDLTQLVRDIQASGPGNNYGVMFQLKYEMRYRSMAFCSFNHPDIRRHPQITIEI